MAQVQCDQAVFTSARGPTGEGYRIVAASKGLRPEEKQKITRCSPSHESLCVASEPGLTGTPGAVSFYSLPTGRYCIAASRHAGAEQSGRGGMRVYTHNLIISEETFAACRYNPFHIVRAMPESSLNLQKLPGGGVLPGLEFAVDTQSSRAMDARCLPLLPTAARGAALECLLNGKPVVVDLSSDWLSWAEAMLLAIPAPLRAKMSIGAGLRFSASRGHVLNFLRDDKKAVGARASAQGLNFVNPAGTFSPGASNWLSFVERLWASGNLVELDRRTSRWFEDCTAATRERIGGMYDAMDEFPQCEILQILEVVIRSIGGPRSGIEAEISRELRDAARSEIMRRLSAASWNEFQSAWGRFVEFWRNGGETAMFVQPIVRLALQAAMKADPFIAMEQALAIVNAPTGVDRDAHESLLNQVAGRFVEAASGGHGDDPDKAQRLVARWRMARSGCTITKEFAARTPCPGAA